MGFALTTILRGELRTLLWACLAALALGGFGPRESRALDPVGLEVAADEVRAALEQMADALNAAPRDVQTTISADLHLMSQAVTRALGRIENGAVPIADPTLVYDLNFLADIATAATRELEASAVEDAGGLAADRIARIEALADAAAARLVEVNLVIDGWTERGRNAVVELAEDGGEVVIRTTDRLIYNSVRYTSVGLLLVGLLVVGLQLLRMSEDRVDSFALLRETPVLSILAVMALTLFFVGCFAFSLYPGSLAALSAEIRQQPQEHPCERLAEQRYRLIDAQQVEHPGLVEATKQRMTPAARDCLGLPSETATAEAIDLLAARTAVARNEAQRPAPAGVAVAVAEPEEQASDGDGTPSEIAEPEQPASDGDSTPPELAEREERASDGDSTPQPETAAREEPASDGDSTSQPEIATREGASDGDSMALPEIAEPSDQAQTAEPDALSDLTAQIESAEEALSERLEGALAEELEAAAITPALEPEPAAGPPPPDEPAAEPVQASDAGGAADAPTPDSVPEPKPPVPATEPPAPDAEGGAEPELYVTTTAVNYRAGPSLEAPRLGTFVPGATLAVIDQNDGWSEVRLGDGREVFVASEFLELAP